MTAIGLFWLIHGRALWCLGALVFMLHDFGCAAEAKEVPLFLPSFSVSRFGGGSPELILFVSTYYIYFTADPAA